MYKLARLPLCNTPKKLLFTLWKNSGKVHTLHAMLFIEHATRQDAISLYHTFAGL